MKKTMNGRTSHSTVSPFESVTQGVNLPCDPLTKQPIPPRAQPGYYPDYDVLQQQNFWDEATRKVVLDRLENVPPIRFFTPDELPLMQAVCDRLIPQDDRDDQHKIPVVNYIDRRLYEKHIDGYRYEDMPPDDEAFRLGLQAIDSIAHHLYQTPFVDLNPLEQDTVLKTIHDGEPPAAQEIWNRMAVHHFWLLLLQDAVNAYYAHPYAWNEIGFGGPAYPRGYMRLEHGRPEPWETEEQRYEWEAPANSLSDRYEPIGGPQGHKQQTPGQGGTH
jgi:hypothetical protein